MLKIFRKKPPFILESLTSVDWNFICQGQVYLNTIKVYPTCMLSWNKTPEKDLTPGTRGIAFKIGKVQNHKPNNFEPKTDAEGNSKHYQVYTNSCPEVDCDTKNCGTVECNDIVEQKAMANLTSNPGFASQRLKPLPDMDLQRPPKQADEAATPVYVNSFETSQKNPLPDVTNRMQEVKELTKQLEKGDNLLILFNCLKKLKK